jgi:hypothetical protein
MKVILDALLDLVTLSSPFRSENLLDFAGRLARWVFLLILSLTITGMLLAIAGR